MDRRGVIAGLGGALVVATIALSATGAAGQGTQGAEAASSAAVKELPRGGTSVLPQYRPVAFDGAPQSPALGPIGQSSPSKLARRLKRQARPYGRIADKPVYPTLHLIATIALAGPGADGKYRARQKPAVIRRYLKLARKHRFLLVLDIQPGRSKFITEVRRLRPWLRNRNVGIALDPEWNMGRGGVPGERIGSVGAGMINRVSRLMSKVAARHRLPDKLLVIHQFTPSMVRGVKRIRARRGVDLVLNVDGFGSPSEKRATYERLRPPRRGPLHPGFKLFYEEDRNLMSPPQVMRLKPRPRFVLYE